MLSCPLAARNRRPARKAYPGFAGVVFPLIRTMIIKPGVRKGMNMLKANLESNAA